MADQSVHSRQPPAPTVQHIHPTFENENEKNLRLNRIYSQLEAFFLDMEME